MKTFQQLFEHEIDDLTHEVLTYHGFERKDDVPGGYKHRDNGKDHDPDSHGAHVGLDLETIGWKREGGPEGDVDFFMHPETGRKMAVRREAERGRKGYANVGQSRPIK